MHFCKAKIQIGGDKNNAAVRTEFDPVSWPEIELLMMIHGDESITEVIPFVVMEQGPKDEKERLAAIYGGTAVTEAWGRRNPPEMEAPDATLQAGLVWKNPLTGQIEKTGKGGKGSGSYQTPPPPPPSGAFESRPAVEIVGNPMAGNPPLEPEPESEPEPEVDAETAFTPLEDEPAPKAASAKKR
jgi:hypothetical protein